MTLNTLFTIDVKGAITIKPEALAIKSIKKLSDYNIKTFGYGNTHTAKELVYIHFYLDKSIYTGYAEENRKKHIIKRLDLSIDWKPSLYVETIIKELQSDFETISEKSVRVLSDTLHRFIDLLDAIGKRNETKFETLSDLDFTSLDDESEGKRLILLEQLEKDLIKTLKFNVELPKAIDQLEQLMNKIKKESNNDKNVGSKTANRFEDGN